jgi:hypothetical protein
MLIAVRGASNAHDPAGLRARELEDLREAETRLLRAFAATVTADEVREYVRSAYAHYERVPVRTYVVLLTERRAARELHAVHRLSDRSA